MKHVVVVLTEPTVGQEEEFNEYYEKLHIDEVLETAGWESGQRFQLTKEVGIKCPQQYLALYEVEADNADEVLQTLNDTRSQRQQSKALNKKTAALWIFSETGPKHEHPNK